MSMLYTRKEVAAIFGVIPHTIFFWEKKGKIKPVGYVSGRPRYSLESIEGIGKDKQEVFTKAKMPADE